MIEAQIEFSIEYNSEIQRLGNGPSLSHEPLFTETFCPRPAKVYSGIVLHSLYRNYNSSFDRFCRAANLKPF